MNLAVLKYEFLENKPDGIPNSWPAETRELGNSTQLPGEDWVLMTRSEFDDYLEDNRVDYDAWYASSKLEDAKKSRIIEIDTKTQYLISQGFVFDSHRFSLSLPAQINWSGLVTLQNLLSWPMNVTTWDDREYSLTLENLLYFISTGKDVITSAIDSGRSLKLSVNDAETIEELNNIIDSR